MFEWKEILWICNGQESTRPIIHDSDIFKPISLIEGLPTALGNALWSTLKPNFFEFVRISWIVYLVIKLVCFVSFSEVPSYEGTSA